MTRVDADLSIIRIMFDQIGRMTLLATSGGRYSTPDRLTLILPVAHGYSVEVVYNEGADDYTVRRVFTRAGKRFIKGERTSVYCDEISEVVYRAGCYHHPFD